MVNVAQLYALSKAYPLIAVIVGMILFFIGLKITAKLFRWIVMGAAAIAIIAAIIMFFR